MRFCGLMILLTILMNFLGLTGCSVQSSAEVVGDRGQGSESQVSGEPDREGGAAARDDGESSGGATARATVADDGSSSDEYAGGREEGREADQQEHQERPVSSAQSQDQRYRNMVIGTWEDDYEGHRTMTLRADGTGTMVVELSGMKAALFASRLEFNMEWSLEEGRLRKRTIDGKPAGRVSMILKMMGDEVNEPILELTSDRLLLLDKDGETQYDWRRKADPSSAP